jgi:hypothetical protein
VFELCVAIAIAISKARPGNNLQRDHRDVRKPASLHSAKLHHVKLRAARISFAATRPRNRKSPALPGFLTKSFSISSFSSFRQLGDLMH